MVNYLPPIALVKQLKAYFYLAVCNEENI